MLARGNSFVKPVTYNQSPKLGSPPNDTKVFERQSTVLSRTVISERDGPTGMSALE